MSHLRKLQREAHRRRAADVRKYTSGVRMPEEFDRPDATTEFVSLVKRKLVEVLEHRKVGDSVRIEFQVQCNDKTHDHSAWEPKADA